MKKFRLTRKVQIILATILAIVAGVIIVGIFSNNKAMAITDCPYCGGACTYEYQSSGNGSTHVQMVVCNTCGTIETKTFQCTGGSWTQSANESNGHARYCVYCGYATATGTCYDNNDDGNCDVCGRSGMHVHNYTKSYTQNNDETHNVTLTCSCGDTKSGNPEAHNFGTPADNNNGAHTQTCVDCEYEKTEQHTGATHANGGKCIVCNAEYETHEQSNTIIEYKKTETTHIPVYDCTEEECTETYDGIEQLHNYGQYTKKDNETHSATCTTCEYERVESHVEVIDEAEEATCTKKGKTEGKHCSVCNEILIEQKEIPLNDHNYVNDVCTVCGQTKIEDDPELSIISDKYEIDDNYVSKIQPKTTVEQLKENIQIENDVEINIYNAKNELLTDTNIIGTNMKIELKAGSKTKIYTAIVKGDVDGNGIAEMIDMVIINKHRLNKKTLEGAYLKAADVTEDTKINLTDIIKINKYRLNKITEL